MDVKETRNAINDCRPYDLSTFICNSDKLKELENVLGKVSDQVRSFLISGQPGHGKTTFAYIFKNNLESGCKSVGSPGVEIVEFNCASSRGVDVARDEIGPLLLSPPLGGGYRVLILDECHMLTPEAQTALLKPIESMPNKVFLFACSSEPAKISPALKSRLKHITMNLPTGDKVDQRFKDSVVSYVASVCDKLGYTNTDENIPKLVSSYIQMPYSIRDFTLDIVRVINGESVDFIDTNSSIKKSPHDLGKFLVSGKVKKEHIPFIFDVVENFDCGIDYARKTISEYAYRDLRSEISESRSRAHTIIHYMDFDPYCGTASHIFMDRVMVIVDTLLYEKQDAIPWPAL